MTPSNDSNTLHVTQLNASLEELRPRTTQLSGNYKASTGIGGFAPVLASLLTWFAAAWVYFEQNGCKALLDSYQAFRTAKNLRGEQLNANFIERLESAKAAFVESIRKSAQDFNIRNRERWEALAHAQTELPKIKKELWLHTFRMTGDGNNVEHVDYVELDKKFKMWFFGILAIEVVLGIFIFELKSNRLFALAMSVGSAMGIMFARHKASEAKALINGAKDALDAYRAKFPNGRLDFEGQMIKLFPLSSTVKQTYFKAELMYWLTSIGLLAWRVYVSMTDHAAGLIGVIGSLMVIALSSAYGYIAKYPSYQHHLQLKWEELTNDLASCEADIVEFSKPDPKDPYSGEVATAKEQYHAEVTAARNEIASDLHNRRRVAETVLDLQAQYEQALSGTRGMYEGMWGQAVSAACIANPEADSSFFANPANAQSADDMFGNYVRGTLTQRDLLVEAKSFDPRVTLTAAPLSSLELDGLASETEKAVSLTAQLQNGAGSVVINRENR